jgi:hypothetical protein
MNAFSRGVLIVLGVAATVVGIGSASASPASNNLFTATPAPAAAAPAAAIDPQLSPETVYTAVKPCRVADTRAGGGILGTNVTRSFYVAGTFGFAPQGGTSGGCGVPIGATSVTVTIAAVGPRGAGNLIAWAAGGAQPNASVLNYFAEFAVSSGATVPLAATSSPQLSVRNTGPAVHVVLDVTGYYRPQIQALIGGDGSIQAGTGRIVSTSHAGTGFYYLTLDRPARQCSPSAVTYNFGHYASVGLSSSSTPNVVSVSTWNVNSAGSAVLADLPFFFTATC